MQLLRFQICAPVIPIGEQKVKFEPSSSPVRDRSFSFELKGERLDVSSPTEKVQKDRSSTDGVTTLFLLAELTQGGAIR